MAMNDGDEDSIVAEINITPLTDIFLVLLVIFMISSSALLESGLTVKLPSAKTTSPAQTESQKPVSVTLARDGRIVVGKAAVTESELAKAIRTALDETSNKAVVVRGDADVSLGKTVKVMDAARSAGAEKITIATQPAIE
jgi:biopolymer transport protein ExbD